MKKRVITFVLAVFICFASVIPAFAEEGFADLYYRVVDGSGLLQDTDREELILKLDEISVRQKMDVVVMTTEGTEGYSIETYADDMYKACSYGYGESLDGVMLLIDMESRSWYITTCGYGITAFTDSGIQYIGEQMTSYLSSGDYVGAFNIYAEKCDEFITLARNGEPFEWGNASSGEKGDEPLSVIWIPISVVIGVVIALVVVGNMKGKLKTVKKKKEAGTYVRNGSLVVNENYDTFLYSQVTKAPIPKQTSSSGGSGSSTHTSSSGTTHGGGGGKF